MGNLKFYVYFAASVFDEYSDFGRWRCPPSFCSRRITQMAARNDITGMIRVPENKIDELISRQI